jgi:hypothetical protein
MGLGICDYGISVSFLRFKQVRSGQDPPTQCASDAQSDVLEPRMMLTFRPKSGKQVANSIFL